MKHLDELIGLGLPADDFAVFGSGPIAIRGLCNNDDIDVIARPNLWQSLSQKYPVIDNKEIRIGNISIYKDWLPWFDDAEALINGADIIKGIRFVKLENVLKWKQAFNRNKDKEHAAIIKKFLNANQSENF